MDDLDRLFKHLVALLADQAPDRLQASFEVAELYQQLVPYRQHRAALKFESNQDYEMALLRLLSGVRGYATVEPGEVQEVLKQEAEAVNPDPGLFREYAAARVRLNAAAVRTALGARSAYVPPLEHPPPAQPPAPRQPPTAPLPHHGTTASDLGEPEPAPAAPEPGLARTETSADEGVEDSCCPYCGEELPAARNVFYCPFCGGNVKNVECPKCGTGLEVGWAFCITCGQKVGRA